MNEDLNKELCQLLGICWHEPDLTYWDKKRIPRCKKCKQIIPMIDSEQNPDFTSDSGKVRLLREMMKRKDYNHFSGWLWNEEGNSMRGMWLVEAFLLDDTDKLAIATRDFLKGQKKQ